MTRFNSAALLVLSTIVSAVSAAPYSARTAQCDRTVLLAATDAYVAAQTAGLLTPLQPFLASNWTYQENNKIISPTTGVLRKPLKPDHRRTNSDLLQCATYTELVVADAENPYVIGTQLRLDVNSKVRVIDTIASTTGSWLFDAKKTLQYVQQEIWAPIPADKQDPRAAIQAAGDAYMDMWNNATADKAVPWGTPCVRLEGSVYTGSGKPDDSCKPGIPSNHSQAGNTHRRYVIDEAMGSVSIFCVWEHMMMAADSHEFRLEGGRLRFVHTMTTCGDRVCRL
ncbi:hypothetical protein GQ43DRAFT_251638 [Delitschia confertaspora ATCC 74209]|uniref:DUF8021 domain-containing protein n=1 Tax=Delitschia confertaspora ATCC 74209 TaxID=1513339 RepID=A0A9P4MS22_9PLEO|nr:hypothetical protein GQ43DRAFT_251638 [Delitschia confertaspora ATCC 74209]